MADDRIAPLRFGWLLTQFVVLESIQSHPEVVMSWRADTLFAGTGRYVVAVRADSGTELWRTKLPSTMGNIVSLMLDGDRLFVGHAGRVYCLNAQTGTILWENGLPRTGHAAVIMAVPGVTASIGVAIAAAQLAANAARAAAAGAG
jgi:outer membrane protein assembly factor BamB